MMNNLMKAHTFHIPVMGIGYTIDTPLKVSPYGIDSVISLVDDILLEKLRKMYCEKYEILYDEITEKMEDFRAKRITSYLNLISDLASKKFEELKNATAEKSQELKEYFSMLPDSSTLKQEFKNLTSKYFHIDEIKSWAKDHLQMGSIDVNIMTKVDKDNYVKGEKLPVEYNDAHAALRGFANSDLSSSVVLSAGMNPRLYSYFEHFEDFYPDATGNIKKKIVLKVSDYKSALIQGKFFAKKGLWISEYRIESGLNCGGHAFATDGFLMGPILAEFRDNRKELIDSIHEVLVRGLTGKNRPVPATELPLKITAQGGVGTSEEHEFLIDHYKVDSVGWGSPFMLVPEAVSIDESTINKLIDANEEDLYLSGISPLGIPFNTLKGNTKDIEKMSFVAQGKPGAPCTKKFAALNGEFTDRTLCTASRAYQSLKIKELDKEGLSAESYKERFKKIVEKSCICVGLGTSTMKAHDMDTTDEGDGISVCPGPNMAYFSKKMTMKEMIDHIYGRANMISRTDRPNMFVKELKLYIDYLKDKIEETRASMTNKQEKYLVTFVNNLKDGVSYYQHMFSDLKHKFEDSKANILGDLDSSKKILNLLDIEIENLKIRAKAS